MGKLLLGDSLVKLAEIETNSADAVVTDPPYGLAFMNKKWDYDVPSVELWREVLRVLKPGGHLLSFGGTRTYHRMVVAIEDAGFEIRDQVQWIYGSGFPKSLDVSKAIDKAAGETRLTAYKPNFKNNDYGKGMGGGEWNAPSEPPRTDDAKAWSGWGTALKPANEPIVLARKPLEKGLTVAENVLKWGTGAINVDGTRIGYANEMDKKLGQSARPSKTSNANEYSLNHGGLEGFDRSDRSTLQGRWPANVIFDETAAAMLDEQSGPCKTGGRNIKTNCGDAFFKVNVEITLPPDNGSGASRFFYVAKASKRERNAGLEGMPARESGVMDGNSGRSGQRTAGDGVTPIETPKAQNHHPTVKPVKLMEYLCKLVTPPTGVILDPFMGSGSTGVAAKKLGFVFIGIEREPEYLEIAKRRIEHVQETEHNDAELDQMEFAL